MQTQTLPIQISGAAPAPQRTNAAPTDGAQFSQSLSREMEQRHTSAAPAAAAPAAPAKQEAAPAPAGQPAPAPAKTSDTKSAKTDTDTDTSTDEAKDDAANAAAPDPVADMLAFVASFNQPAAATAQPAADPVAAAAAAATGVAAAELPVKAGKDVKADALAADGKAPALPAGDDKALTFKDVAQAIVPMKDAKPKDAEPAAPPAIAGAGKSGAEKSLSALAASVNQKPEADAAAPALKVGARTEPASARTETTPAHAREAVAEITAMKEPVAAAAVIAPVQQASLAMAQAITGAPTDRIAARVGMPGWDNQVGQKIVWMVAGKEQSASLTLNPPDMGPMQVVLSVTNDQATVTFSAAQPEVRQALEDAMPKLREMMGESGITLGNATVDSGASGQRQAQQGERAGGHGTGARFGGAGVEAPISTAARQVRVDGGIGMVDTFA
ncbi:MAG TPA: flagellar hook-length control protein FliK [Telluria sp.]|nr:flagellar hook-length control protein FliK [Telluria sp.]